MTNSETTPFVTIVIALKNEMGYIDQCLDSLLRQSYSKDAYEILVYDGNSDDGSADVLAEYAEKYPQMRVFPNPEEVGAAGWNKGFAIARGKYVVMMGAHTYVDDDFLAKNVQLLENNPEVPCSGGRVISLGQDTKSKAIALAFNHPFGAGNAKYRYAREPCLVETVNYGTYRKSVVDEVGPINEGIKRGEDWEYNYRIVSRYGKMLFSPDIVAFYFSRSTFKQLWRRQYDAGYHKVEIICDYPGSMLFRHVVPALFSAAVILAPIIALLLSTLWPLVLIYGIYLGFNLGVSAVLSLKNGLRYFPHLILAFFVTQFAYGLGFIANLRRVLTFRTG